MALMEITWDDPLVPGLSEPVPSQLALHAQNRPLPYGAKLYEIPEGQTGGVTAGRVTNTYGLGDSRRWREVYIGGDLSTPRTMSLANDPAIAPGRASDGGVR